VRTSSDEPSEQQCDGNSLHGRSLLLDGGSKSRACDLGRVRVRLDDQPGTSPGLAAGRHGENIENAWSSPIPSVANLVQSRRVGRGRRVTRMEEAMAERTTRKARKAERIEDLAITGANANDVVGGDTSTQKPTTSVDRPTESLSLNFSKVTFTYTP
jgi:hypothetical protein